MSNSTFRTPQRQSVTGIALIFATSLYHIIKNFWAVAIYLIVMDPAPKIIFFAILGAVAVLFISLGYSIAYYLKFLFYIDEEKNSFILQKGVFNSDFISIPFSKIQQVNFQRNILQRVIGVYSVVIDTAGSTDKEVEIKALSKEKADDLAELLMELSSREKVEEKPFSEEVQRDEFTEKSKIDWQYKLDLLRLLKLGLTSNYFRGLSILLAFYFTIRSQFNYSEEVPAELNYSILTEMFSTMALMLMLLIIGMIATVVETFIKYFGLEIQKSRAGLQVEMGLRNNKKVNIKNQRVQLLQESTNPVHRRLEMHKLKISLASSQDEFNKDQIKIPGLPAEVVAKVKNYFYGKEVVGKKHILPHKMLLFRKISRRTFPLLTGIAVLFIFADGFPWWWIAGGGFLLILFISVYQYFHYKSLCLHIADDFLVKSSGVWRRKKQYLEIYKLQSVSMVQPVWYKRRGLVHLTFHSAGGDIMFPMVKKQEITGLMNYLLYKIESTEKPWM
ncbi:PH domain-containing protein [Salinimicrobium sp. GXAS 041]|uniref:PH domain-containing protein n=1 Tax=Salinimicrobium sp. GXAS 041 TaxID=3400806 RepID=UPI003C76EE11